MSITPNTNDELLLAERISAICHTLKQGQLVLVMDDNDREGEGDLMGAASHMTEKAMAFMIRHTSGIICTPLTARRAKTLELYEMVPRHHNDAPHQTAFTVSVDGKKDLTTGISAKERLATVRLLAEVSATPNDFVKPGHIFPLIAKEGGVLTRAGHTEAAVDLMTLAQLPDIGVIGELVNDDGSVKKGQELTSFAKQHRLLTITIDDIIAYRQGREQLLHPLPIEKITLSIDNKTIIGSLCPYRGLLDDSVHYGLVLGDMPINPHQSVLTRLHVETMPYDILPLTNQPIDHRHDLSRALSLLAKESVHHPSLLVYLRRGGIGVGGSHPSARERTAIWREVGVGAQILRHLGVRRINLIAHQKKQYLGLSGFGLTIDQWTNF